MGEQTGIIHYRRYFPMEGSDMIRNSGSRKLSVMMLVFGFIIVDRLSTPGSGKNVDSLIFTSPGVDDSNGPSGDNSSGNNVGSDSTTNTNKEYNMVSKSVKLL